MHTRIILAILIAFPYFGLGSGISQSADAAGPNLIPDLNDAKLRFGTGRSQNNQPEISKQLPALPGEPSKWYVAQWHQDVLISAAPMRRDDPRTYNPEFGVADIAFDAADAHSHIWIYDRKRGADAVYELFESGGWLASGGGSNLFLATTIPSYPALDVPLRFSMRAKISNASVAYNTPSAMVSGAVLGMAFVGFVMQFPSPVNTTASTLFLQVPLTISRPAGAFSSRCAIKDGHLRVLSGGALPPAHPYPFRPDSGPLHTVSFQLDDYVVAIFSKPLRCTVDGGQARMLSLKHVDLSQTKLGSIYIGLEAENIDKRIGAPQFGQRQGSIALGVMISDVRLQAMEIPAGAR